jgi:FtsH-binding integral membrane protein
VLETLTFFHQRFALALIVLAAVLGLWGSYGYLRHRAVTGGFRSSYLLMIGLTAVQGGLGVVSFALGNRPHELLHVVYGIFAIAFLPGLYFYSARGSREREALLLALSCWIVAVAYARGWFTG